MSTDVADRITGVIAQLSEFEQALKSLQGRAEHAVGGSATKVDRTMVEALGQMRRSSQQAQAHLQTLQRLLRQRV